MNRLDSLTRPGMDWPLLHVARRHKSVWPFSKAGRAELLLEALLVVPHHQLTTVVEATFAVSSRHVI